MQKFQKENLFFIFKNMTTDMQTLVTFAKTKGFVYQGSEIYGGLANSWDYAPLGALLKENIKNLWIKNFVQKRRDMVLLDSAILMNPQVWVASGHVGGFSDPLIDDKNTKERFRADKLLEDLIEKMGADAENLKTKYGVNNLIPESWPLEKQTEVMIGEAVENPNTGEVGDWSDAKQFNLMFKTSQGVTEDSSATVYLRPETAQGIFVKKVPFGIAQVGKSFRNEITPGNFIFRTREFEQMEIEFFCEPESVAPGKHLEWHEFWKKACWDFLVKTIGISENSLRMRDHEPDELSHYSDATTDIEFQFPFGWGELWGIADRTDFDLRAHMNESKQDLSYFDQDSNERWIPYVIEPAAGLGRSLMAFLVDAYHEDEAPNAKGGVDKRVVLKLDRRLSPVKVAVLPLSKKETLTPVAEKVAAELRQFWSVDYDTSGAIGRRYRRQDEIGTPFCVTVDFDTLEDNAVTVRERDTMAQERISLSELQAYLAQRLIGC